MFRKTGFARAAVAVAVMASASVGQASSIEDFVLVNGDPWHRTIWVTMKPTDPNGDEFVGRHAPQFTLCLKPRESRSYSLEMADNGQGYIIRGEITRNADCQQPVDCDTSINVRTSKPGSRNFVFDADREKCWVREHVPVQ